MKNASDSYGTYVKRSLTDFPMTARLKMLAGRCALPFCRRRAREINADPFGRELGALDKLVRKGLYTRAFMSRNHTQLRRFLSNYWNRYADGFHQAWKDRFERVFLKHDAEIIISALEELTQHTHPQNLVEIGCGGGQVLAYLSDHLEGIQHFTGIDLSEERISENRRDFQHRPDLAFHAGDAVDWVQQHTKRHTVFLTNGGVLEYFLQSELQCILQHIATHGVPAAMMIIENIGSDHDLDREKDSLIYGREMSFSHNYPYLFEQAGFAIQHYSERTGEPIDGGGRWVRILAVKS